MLPYINGCNILASFFFTSEKEWTHAQTHKHAHTDDGCLCYGMRWDSCVWIMMRKGKSSCCTSGGFNVCKVWNLYLLIGTCTEHNFLSVLITGLLILINPFWSQSIFLQVVMLIFGTCLRSVFMSACCIRGIYAFVVRSGKATNYLNLYSKSCALQLLSRQMEEADLAKTIWTMYQSTRAVPPPFDPLFKMGD